MERGSRVAYFTGYHYTPPFACRGGYPPVAFESLDGPPLKPLRLRQHWLPAIPVILCGQQMQFHIEVIRHDAATTEVVYRTTVDEMSPAPCEDEGCRALESLRGPRR